MSCLENLVISQANLVMSRESRYFHSESMNTFGKVRNNYIATRFGAPHGPFSGARRCAHDFSEDPLSRNSLVRLGRRHETASDHQLVTCPLARVPSRPGLSTRCSTIFWSDSSAQGASKDCSRGSLSRVRDLVRESSGNLLEELEGPSDLLE